MSMTSVEQYLTQVEREVRAMCRDSLGSISRSAYADRVIEDVCGVENLASSIIATSNPMAVLLNAFRGTRGDVLMRFFDMQLHSARLELVEALVEAGKFSRSGSRNSRDSVAYLRKLYGKGVKRIRELVGGKRRTREIIEDRFPTLGDITGYGSRFDEFDYGFDDDEDDRETDYTDYADEYLNALREGREPPKPRTYPTRDLGLDLKINNELFDMISKIETRIGRKLTSREIAAVITEAEKDSEPDQGPSWDEMIATISQAVAAKLGASIPAAKPTEPPEDDDEEIHLKDDLDEFLKGVEKPEEKPSEKDPPRAITLISGGSTSPVRSVVKDMGEDIKDLRVKVSSLEDKLKEGVKEAPILPVYPEKAPVIPDPIPKAEKSAETISTRELIQRVNDVAGDSGVSEEDTPSETEPPVHAAGGDDDLSDEDIDEGPEVSISASDDDYGGEGMLEKIFFDPTVFSSDQTELSEQFTKYLQNLNDFVSGHGASLDDNIVSLLPSVSPEHLYDVRIDTIINGDPGDFNILQLNAINSRLCSHIARFLNIDVNLINLISNLTSSSYCEDPNFITRCNVLKGWCETDQNLHVQNSMILAGETLLTCNILPDIRYIMYHGIDEQKVHIFVGRRHHPSMNTPSDEDVEQYRQKVKAVVPAVYLGAQLGGQLYFLDSETEDTLFKTKLEALLGSPTVRTWIEEVGSLAVMELKERLVRDYDMDPETVNVVFKTTDCTTPYGACVDLQYVVEYPDGKMDVSDEQRFREEFDGIFIVKNALELLLHSYSPSLSVDAYLVMSPISEDVPEEDVDESDGSTTNAFGLN